MSYPLERPLFQQQFLTTLRASLREMRPHQWIKNLLVLAPLLFSGMLTDRETVLLGIAAFFSFSFASSAVYILNDLRDLPQDKLHPEKRNRPLAKGLLSVSFAWSQMFLLMIVAFGLGMLTQKNFVWLLLIYLLMNVGYSYGLKRMAILDVMMIATGFVIRAVAGAVAINQIASAWLVLCTMMLALLVGFGKRRQELALFEKKAVSQRPTLNGYNLPLLDTLMCITAGAAIVTYSLYTMAAETISRFGSKALVLTIPFVIFGIFRYLLLIHVHPADDDPIRILVTDPSMILNGSLWALSCAGIVYQIISWPFW